MVAEEVVMVGRKPLSLSPSSYQTGGTAMARVEEE